MCRELPTCAAVQTVLSGGQQWDTWLVEPDLSQIKHVFEKNPHARLQIWVTADERRIPVKLQSKIAVGSFTAELVRIETPGGRCSCTNCRGNREPCPVTARYSHAQPPEEPALYLRRLFKPSGCKGMHGL